MAQEVLDRVLVLLSRHEQELVQLHLHKHLNLALLALVGFDELSVLTFYHLTLLVNRSHVFLIRVLFFFVLKFIKHSLANFSLFHHFLAQISAFLLILFFDCRNLLLDALEDELACLKEVVKGHSGLALLELWVLELFVSQVHFLTHRLQQIFFNEIDLSLLHSFDCEYNQGLKLDRSH